MRRILLVLVVALVVVAPAGAWTWPADGPVIQPYSFDHEFPKAAGQHRGVDVAGELGASVRAPATGVVSFAGTVPTNGKCVTIETAEGLSVTLTHLGAILVTKGASVVEGDGVGTIGPSGEPGVSQAHVHLGIRRAADEYGYLDPVTMLPTRLPVASDPVAPPVTSNPAPSVPAEDGLTSLPAGPPPGTVPPSNPPALSAPASPAAAASGETAPPGSGSPPPVSAPIRHRPA